MNTLITLTRKLSVLVLLFMACVFTTSAADFMVDSICYNIIGENEVEVTKRDSVRYSGEVIIPATVVNDGVTYQVTRIGASAFAGCKYMTLVDIPEGVLSLGNSSFEGCYALESIDLPNSLVSIGKWAFWACHGLTQFHVSRNLVDIAYNAFMDCYNIACFTCSSMNPRFKSVSGILYTKDMTTLYAYPPAATATRFEIPGTVTSLYDYCFSYNHYLERVIIPESVTWMGMNIFRDCSQIDSIYIPDGVTHMGVTVFGNCDNLTYVHLPASLDSIMSSTFLNCSTLTELTIPRNVSYLDQMSFGYVPALKRIYFEEGSRLKTLSSLTFRQCDALESFDMPNSVDSVPNSCFYECPSLKSLHLSENLRILDRVSICYCPSLTECEIPGTVAVINMPFLQCDQLKRVKFGDKNSTPGTTLIKSNAFFMSNNVEYIELGANIDSLEHYAFLGVNNLKVIKCWATVPPRSNTLFSSFPQNAVLYVPRASLEDYRTAVEWKRFNTIVPIEDIGDVNGDGAINISDALTLINILLNDETPLSPALTDVNLDGDINISDAMALINQLLNEAK